MRACHVQRVSRARVLVDGVVKGEIGAGLLVLIAVGREDTAATAASMAEKVIHLRIFNDEQGKMRLPFSLSDTGGAILAVSQFTLYGDVRGQQSPRVCRQAAPPEQGKVTLLVYAGIHGCAQSSRSACRNGGFPGSHVP